MTTESLSQHSARLTYRPAVADDSPTLATMNRRLIVDEGHSNPMAWSELEARMRYWLEMREYQATLIEHEGTAIGYALWQPAEDWLYLRHFFIEPEHRRNGFGREAMAWLRLNLWNDKPRIRLDVLVGNTRALAFWRALGFEDYFLTLELRDQ